jgi:hypothetical protein
MNVKEDEKIQKKTLTFAYLEVKVSCLLVKTIL